MNADQIIAAVGIYLGTFVIAAIGSVIPIVSIEVFLVGITIALAPSAHSALALVLLAAAGQLLGKLPIYAAARGLTSLQGPQRVRIDRIRRWVARSGRSPNLVLAAGTVLGLPPFSIMATAAGVLAIRVRTFCLIVGVGRALRFAAIVAITSWST